MSSEQFGDLLYLLGSAAAYGGVGLVMLLLGGWVIDLLIPGELPKQIWRDGNLNASIIAASGLFGFGIVIVVAIRAASDDLVAGLLDVVAYSVGGMLLWALTFFIIDLVTPGELGETVTEDKFHPAVIVTAVVNVLISMIVAAAIY